MKKITLDVNRQNELMKQMLNRIFGTYCEEIEFSKWELMQEEIIIKDISWSEDLISILDRLRENFYVRLHPRVEDEEIDTDDGKEIYHHATLDLELSVRD